jgi:hypothetical protein
VTYIPTFIEDGVDVPAFRGEFDRLLFQGQRTNSVPNPRCEGVVAGTPGTMPTGWFFVVNPAPTVTIAAQTRNGIAGMLLTLSGTAIASASFQTSFHTTYPAASVGQAWTGSFFYQVDSVSGFGATPFVQVRVEERTNAGVQLAASATNANVPPNTFGRLLHTRTLNNALTEAVRLVLGTSPATVGDACALTMWIGWPQLELGAFASTPILPATGTPAASTRGADLVSTTLASRGIGGNGACTVIGTAMIPQNAPSGEDQMIVQIDDGTDNNRFRIRNLAGGATIVAGDVNAGSATDATSAGSMTAGTLFRWGISIDGLGRIASCVNGGTVQVSTGGPTSGLTTLRIGNSLAGTAGLFGELGAIRVIPYLVTDAQLTTLVAELPIS